jgi:hypothetical protein
MIAGGKVRVDERAGAEQETACEEEGRNMYFQAWRSGGDRERKAFFFEKKKQKTFGRFACQSEMRSVRIGFAGRIPL